MGLWDILILVIVIVGALGAGLFFLNRWASKRIDAQQSMIEKTKQSTSIYVIDKKRDKAENVNLPKAVSSNLPKTAKLMKLYFVKAKIGPQIMTLICEKQVFHALSPKKNYQVELSGIYIANVKGMKSKYELKQAAKKRQQDAKAKAKEEKQKAKS